MRLGFQIPQWVEDAIAKPDGNAFDSVALISTNTAINTAAGVLEVSLVPQPLEATKALPKDIVQRTSYAFATFKQWRSQINQRLSANEYLFAHYLVGESIGHLRLLLAIGSEDPSLTQPTIEKIVLLTREFSTLPQIKMSAALRAKWLDIAQDLMATRSTSQQNSTLRTRLELWFDAFSAEVEARAK